MYIFQFAPQKDRRKGEKERKSGKREANTKKGEKKENLFLIMLVLAHTENYSKPFR